MVSTGIFGTSFMERKLDNAGSAKSDSQVINDDFTKILDGQKSNFKTDDNRKLEVKSEGTTSVKTEEIRSLFKKTEINETDKLNEEDCVEEVATQVMSYFQNVVEKLSEEFNISTEEVLASIDELDFKPTDLLDMKNISKLVMALAGNEDMSMLLVDDKLSNLVKEIFGEAESVSESLREILGISDDEFKELLTNAEELIDSDMQSDKYQDDMLVNVQDEQNEIVANSGQISSNVQESSMADSSSNAANNGFNENSHNNAEENVHNSFEGITMESIISNVEEALNNNTAIKESGLSERILNQILDGIYANISEEATSLELQLNPESLGKVSVTVSAKEGILTAQIAAQTEIAKEAIESQIAVLKETFETQGLKVEEIEVTIASRSFDQNLSNESSEENNGSKAKKHISQEELDEINGVRTDSKDMPVEEVLKELGTTVSYQA